jgi:hypothetical protein
MNTTQAPAHRLTFDVPSTRDYLNGGFGDLVAQCACGVYEYVSSRREGAYWHGLHLSNPRVTAYRLLALLVESPMPEGWVEPSESAVAAPAAVRRARICATCAGTGSVEAYGAHGGRFYHFGERVACPDCAGVAA